MQIRGLSLEGVYGAGRHRSMLSPCLTHAGRSACRFTTSRKHYLCVGPHFTRVVLTDRALIAPAVGRQTGTATASTEQWWKKDEDLWLQVHNEDDFTREVLGAQLPVIVDWFASWCTGCQKSYPEVSKLIRREADLRKAFKFVKVCVDDFPKSFSRDQGGVTALPCLSLYRPGQGRVLTWGIPLSRVQHLKKNLTTILQHPNSMLALDPNNFIMSTGPMPTKQQAQQSEASRAAAVSALERGSESLFERLSAIANKAVSHSSSSSTAAPAAPAAPAAARATKAATASTAGAEHQPASARGSDVPRAQAAEEYIATMAAQYGQDFSAARNTFLAMYGSEYGYNGRIDTLYPQEVGTRLRKDGGTKLQHYLDYTGSSVYCQSQLDAVFQELSSTMFGNPHAQNPSSELSSQRIDAVRAMILQHFNADPAEWQIVFTRSATGALKLVGETFPWTKGSTFRYLRENHNSVLGIREYALVNGGTFEAVSESLVERWLRAAPPVDHEPSQLDCIPSTTPASIGAGFIDSKSSTTAAGSVNGTGSVALAAAAAPLSSRLSPTLASSASVASLASYDDVALDQQLQAPTDTVYSLFAYPAEDNFAGVKYPLSWAADIKRRSTDRHKWMVLLDAAAYVPTQPLDLSTVAADFVDIAFYKMFGYPTGLGALLVRTEAVPLLRKVFWGGGSVALATSRDNFHVLKCRPSDKLEDGTVSFLDIISLRHGFDLLNNKLGGVARVQSHVACLTEYLYKALTSMRHSNGRPIAKVYGKHDRPNHRQVQGGIVNFELLSPTGAPLSYRTFEREAAAAGFHVRTGTECNPGACYTYLGVSEQEVEKLAGVKEGCDDDVEFIRVQQQPDQQQGQQQQEQVASADGTISLLSQAQCLALGHPAEVATKWVQVPLGSVRASLGYMSTFEDCYAFQHFVLQNYKDREPVALSSSIADEDSL